MQGKIGMSILGIALLFAAHTVSASGSAGLVDGMWFSNNPLVDSNKTVIYVVLHNQSDVTLKGIATLLVDTQAVTATEVYVPPDTIKRVALLYQLRTGTHTLSVTFTPRNGAQNTVGEVARKKVIVLKDSDKDGIPDIRDTTPYGTAGTSTPTPSNFFQEITQVSRKYVPSYILPKISSTTTKTFIQGTTSANVATSTRAFVRSLEAFRIKKAQDVAVYEKRHKTTLQVLQKRSKKVSTTTTNSVDKVEQSNIKREQIASVGAAILGFTLEKRFIFYGEIVVLILGVLHLLWIWFKALARGREEVYEDEEVYDEEYE